MPPSDAAVPAACLLCACHRAGGASSSSALQFGYVHQPMVTISSAPGLRQALVTRTSPTPPARLITTPFREGARPSSVQRRAGPGHHGSHLVNAMTSGGNVRIDRARTDRSRRQTARRAPREKCSSRRSDSAVTSCRSRTPEVAPGRASTGRRLVARTAVAPSRILFCAAGRPSHLTRLPTPVLVPEHRAGMLSRCSCSRSLW